MLNCVFGLALAYLATFFVVVYDASEQYVTLKLLLPFLGFAGIFVTFPSHDRMFCSSNDRRRNKRTRH